MMRLSSSRRVETEFDHLIEEAPLLREPFEPRRHGRQPFIVSGRPDCWEAAASLLREAGCSVVAFHEIQKGSAKAAALDAPLLHGRISPQYASVAVLFAGDPRKSLFGSSPPAPQRCFWHAAPPKWQCSGVHIPGFVSDHRSALLEFFASLVDDDSKATLASLLKARVEGDTGYHRIAGFTEYDHPVARPNAGEVVIDAGAYDGDTALLYARRVGPHGRVIALEPSSQNYQRLLKRVQVRHLHQVTPMMMGAYDADAVLRFSEGKGASSKLDSEGSAEIRVTSIDKIAKDLRLRRVDVLKLDVEGAESRALEGARETIRRHRPILHVSVYHKPNDLFELPALIRRWLPRYRFYLGHHSYYQMETDLYAVPLERWARGMVSRRLSRATRLLSPRWLKHRRAAGTAIAARATRAR